MTEPKYFKTGTDLRRHLRRTRKTRVRELCEKYNTASYAQAQYLDTVALCQRIRDRLSKRPQNNFDKVSHELTK
jgi:hypothetical protein